MNQANDINVQRMLARATKLGLVGRKGNPVTIDQICELEAARRGLRNSHVMRAADAGTRPVLTPITNEEFVLQEGASEMWVQMGGFKVHLQLTGEGMVADIFADGAENNSIGSTYAFFTDSEDALVEELGIDLDDVAEWVGQHYRHNFDAESPAKRREWIERYRATMEEAKEVMANPTLDLLEEIGYSVVFQLSTDTVKGGWCWVAPSDASAETFASEADAITEAWQDIAGQTMAVHNLSSEQWDSLGFARQAVLIREMFDEGTTLAPAEKQQCVHCGLPTQVDDDGLCNQCFLAGESSSNH